MAFSARVSDAAVAQINVTPLVDVLLVLLVIFMITAPVLAHPVKLDLPQGHGAPPPTEPVRLAIQADGSMRWNDVPISATDWRAELSVASQSNKPWTISIDAADGAPYQAVAAAVADAKSSGASSINFSYR